VAVVVGSGQVRADFRGGQAGSFGTSAERHLRCGSRRFGSNRSGCPLGVLVRPGFPGVAASCGDSGSRSIFRPVLAAAGRSPRGLRPCCRRCCDGAPWFGCCWTGSGGWVLPRGGLGRRAQSLQDGQGGGDCGQQSCWNGPLSGKTGPAVGFGRVWAGLPAGRAWPS
jgi:hypothetical protein